MKFGKKVNIILIISKCRGVLLIIERLIIKEPYYLLERQFLMTEEICLRIYLICSIIILCVIEHEPYIFLTLIDIYILYHKDFLRGFYAISPKIQLKITT